MLSQDEIVLELARLQRAAYENVRKRMSEQQLGEAWKDLAEFDTSRPDFCAT
jgi:hypothetical protein